MENFVEQLATRQARLGHEVRVATLDRIFDDPQERVLSPEEHLHGVQIVRTGFKGSRRYPIAPGVLRALQGADIVHVHGVDFFVDYLAATSAVHRRPLILTTHGGYFHTSFARGLKQVYLETVTRASLSQFAAVIACSAEDERLFRGVSGSRLTLIPNPVDIDKFANLADPSSATIIYFGRLAPNKEVERLIEWFAGLSRQDPGARLIVAGKPMGVDPVALGARAEALGLGKRFELHVTPSDAELRELIGRSGSYACASSYEGFGLAAVEAASAGLFPVLSSIPPFADTLARLGYGLTVNFSNPAGWGRSYDAYQAARDRFTETYEPERVRSAVSGFDWDAAVPRFEEIYRKVLGSSSRAIGPVQIDVLKQDQAFALIQKAVREREPLLVTFCNAHTVNLARRDAAFRDDLKRFRILNDGVGVDLASSALFRSPFPENLNGTDFTPQLLGAFDRPTAVFLVGSAQGVAEKAAAVISSRYPNVRIVGTQHGFFDRDQEPALAATIRESGAELVLAAMGQPQQEAWAARNIGQLHCPVLCVGALLDFLAERVPRAPRLIRQVRMEWAYRLTKEPKRLAGRYLVGNVSFLLGVLKQRLFGPRV